jgi:hypothetical protein
MSTPTNECLLCRAFGPDHEGEHGSSFFLTERRILQRGSTRVVEISPPKEDDR